MASWSKTRRDCRSPRSRFNEIDGRHDWTRTSDLYRVNFEVNNLKPFACLAFPQTTCLKTPRKQPFFGDEFFADQLPQPTFYARTILAQDADTQLTRAMASQGIVSRKETFSILTRFTLANIWPKN